MCFELIRIVSLRIGLQCGFPNFLRTVKPGDTGLDYGAPTHSLGVL